MHDAHAYDTSMQRRPPADSGAVSALAAAASADGDAARQLAGWRRRMQQVAQGTGGRAVVTSARELQDAVAEGVLFIEVQGHLDFTAVPPLRDAAADLLLRAEAGRVKAIWGNCADPPQPDLLSSLPPQPPPLPLEPGQCLIISDMAVLRADGELWLHNLSLRLLSTRRGRGTPVLVEVYGGDPAARLTEAGRRDAEAEAVARPPAAAEAAAEAEEDRRAALWMTRVAIQGDGEAPAHGVRVSSADLYAEGCTFAHLGVSQEAVAASGRLASASFVDCTFAANSALPPTRAPPIISATNSADVRLERCAFPGTAAAGAPVFMAEGGALFFSDTLRAVAVPPQRGAAPRDEAAALPLEDEPVPTVFLQGGDEWLLDTQQASGLLGPMTSNSGRSALPPTPGPQPQPGGNPIPATSPGAGPGAGGIPGRPRAADSPRVAAAPAPDPARANAPAAAPPTATAGAPSTGALAIGSMPVAAGDGGMAGGSMAAAPPPDDTGGLGEGTLAAIACAVFAFVVLAALFAAFVVVRTRRQRRAAAASAFAKITQHGPDTTASFMASGRLPFFDPQSQSAVLMGCRRSDSSSGFPLCTATGAFSSSSTLPSVLHNPSYTTETHNISYPLDSRSTQHAARGAVANLPLHAVQAAKLAGGGASLTPIISVDRGTRSAERSTRCTSAMTACEGSWTETLPDTGSFAPRSAEEGGGGGAKAAAAAAAAAVAAAQLSSTVVPGTFTVGERPTLPENANLRTRIDYIQYQLDCFEPGSEILPGYRMCGGGPGQRFVGGQAVVQTVRHELSSTDYVLKAFATTAAFNAEAALYTDGDRPLGAFLPQMHEILDNAGRGFRDPHGHAMPPCIVMEKGESLDFWKERAAPDQPLVYAVLAHVAKRLQALHAAGYVHRDLKPANVMWLPRENRWTLIDFGCAAAAGGKAPLAFTLRYAAPEVVAAWQTGAGSVLVTPALDAWSLGVMAVELLSGEPVFPPQTLQEKAVAQIMAEGGEVLPWEEGAPRRADVIAALGIFKAPILALLSRSAPRRPAMQQFCALCQAALAGPAAADAPPR